MLKIGLVSIFASATLRNKESGNDRGCKLFVSFDGTMLRACKASFQFVELEFPVTWLYVDFWGGQEFMYVNGLLNSGGVHGWWEGKTIKVLIWCFYLFVLVEKLLDIQIMES